MASGTNPPVDSALYDLGGVREWFGPIPVEADEPVFHHRWEARGFASALASMATLGIPYDAGRWAMERLPREQYLAGYYERWVATAERVVVDKGVLAPGELDAHLAGEQPTVRGHARPGPLARALARRIVRTLMGPMPQWMAPLYARIQGMQLPGTARPRFAIGDRVTVSAAPPTGHTRRPRYTWGKRGTVVSCHFATALPERSAAGERGAREHCYTVELDGRELWGDDAEPGTSVRIDLFESYLEPTS
jgi:nitrile hydratase beta subunit